MDTADLDARADKLVQKIKHLIITSCGLTADKASLEEFYQAFCSALREEMMINWTATLDAIETRSVRILYFLSLEYLPGRLLKNTLINIGAMEIVQKVLFKMGRNLSEIERCENDPGLGHGGLGRLASCFLDSLATLQYPARGYGLRYQYGIFDQEIWDHKQVERPDCWLLNTDPWEIRRDMYAVPIHYDGQLVVLKNSVQEEIYQVENSEEIRALPYDIPIVGYHPSPNYSVITLRLWSTKESPRNFELQRYNAGFLGAATENISLTDVLYPNDNNELGKRVRLKQEYLLIAASLKDIIRRHLKIYGDMLLFAEKVRIQINDTHPALVVAELMRLLMTDSHFRWQEAWETTVAVCGYTNHTILHEGLEEWKEKRVAELLPRQYRIIQRINQQLCDTIRSRFPQDEEKVRRMSMIEEGQIRMAHLAIYGCHHINGVAKLHSEILKTKLFPDFYEAFSEKFTNVTNGISQRRWLLDANPLLATFITERIGDRWIYDLRELSKLSTYVQDESSQNAFLSLKKRNKEALLVFLSEENPMRDAQGKEIGHFPHLTTDALFDVQIKRFHEYKRQLLNLLHLIMLYQERKKQPKNRQVARFSIFAGKAAPGYRMAKQILELICSFSDFLRKEENIPHSMAVAFIENYNVTHAEQIIPAADLSEQISAAGWEASGTGNMKLTLNGALTIATEDGSNIELRQAVGDPFWPFAFGSSASEIAEPYHPFAVYSQDLQIQEAVNFVKDLGFGEIFEYLLQQDPYRVLKDLRSYYETQKKVEQLYVKPQKWAEIVLRNITAMGPFSSDHAIRTYAQNIWGLIPCPPDPETLVKVRQEYAEHDSCRIS